MKRKEAAIQGALSVLAFSVSAICAAGAWAQTAPDSVASTESKQTSAEKVQSLKAALASGATLQPESLGSFSNDQVYTAVTPCRIVDTRIAGGSLQPNTTKNFDVDGTNFASQGGSSSGCGIPDGVASAVAMTITAVAPAGAGNFTAWRYAGTKPTSSALNFSAGQVIANTTIVPVFPGSGVDFSIASNVASNVVIDVVGYFAAPVATALDCVNVMSAITTVPFNSYTAVDASCTAPYTVTGGGTYPTEGSGGRIGIWTDGSPTASSGNGWRTWVDNQASGASRTIQTYARCCRIPGR